MLYIPHPIQYQGSKRNLAPSILTYFPKQAFRVVEPFSGTAAISVGAAALRISRRYWVNDINEPLVRLLRAIIEEPEKTAAAYRAIWNEQHGESIEHYYQVRDRFNRTKDEYLFLYLLARCVKGSVRYNSEGLFNQSPDNRRRGTTPDKMELKITGVSRLLKGKCIFSWKHYREVLEETLESDVVYMDPPYQGVCGDRDSRYYSGISARDFIKALEDLNKKGIRYLVSYDGRRGDKTFGEYLPEKLDLLRIELEAGRSSQATLLGRDEVTVESLYLSPALVSSMKQKPEDYRERAREQLGLFEHEKRYAVTP